MLGRVVGNVVVVGKHPSSHVGRLVPLFVIFSDFSRGGEGLSFSLVEVLVPLSTDDGRLEKDLFAFDENDLSLRDLVRRERRCSRDGFRSS